MSRSSRRRTKRTFLRGRFGSLDQRGEARVQPTTTGNIHKREFLVIALRIDEKRALTDWWQQTISPSAVRQFLRLRDWPWLSESDKAGHQQYSQHKKGW
jgi:hypothetical protein